MMSKAYMQIFLVDAWCVSEIWGGGVCSHVGTLGERVQNIPNFGEVCLLCLIRKYVLEKPLLEE